MLLVKAKGQKIIEYPYEVAHLRRDYPNTIFSGSLPSEPFMVRENIHLVREEPMPIPKGDGVNTNLPTYDPETEYVTQANKPVKDGTSWVLPWVIKKKTKKMIKAEGVREEKRVRDIRDKLLGESDFIVIKSMEKGEEVPLKWKAYRQSLRDITDQNHYPFKINWPSKPV